MKKFIIAIFIILIVVVFTTLGSKPENAQEPATWWKFQSVDTMKSSRDLAREKLNDVSYNKVIEQQVGQIAATGATHIAIATPYDDEFYPILKRWVASARRHNLNVWFRGNWSGWEGWFDYPKITREEHKEKTKEFIEKHKEIFKDGDIFSACPECENGGPGDPRITGDVKGFRKLMVDEYKVTQEAFSKIGKKVDTNFDSMNGDVARLIMDKKTTADMGGVVAIDHYVDTPEKLIADIREIFKNSGGRIVLGEFGAPIPDINGDMTEDEQAEWIREVLRLLAQEPYVIGINYWTNVGSSTSIWNDNGSPKKAVEALKSIYSANILKGKVIDEAGGGIAGAYVTLGGRHYITTSSGEYSLPYFGSDTTIDVNAPGFKDETININSKYQAEIVLVSKDEGLIFKIRKFIHKLLFFL